MMRRTVVISLGGVKISMAPTLRAMEAIESRIAPLRVIYGQVMTGQASLEAMAYIIATGMREHAEYRGEKVSEANCAQMIFDAGPFSEDVITPLADFLAELGWTPEQREKIAAEMEKPGTISD